MLLELVTLGSPLLHKKSAAVKKKDRSLSRLAEDMLDTMRYHQGIGLAAVQVGFLKQLFVVEIPDEMPGPLVCVNPRLKNFSREKHTMEEGCLSIPGVRYAVRRSSRVQLDFLDLDFKPHTLMTEGLLARCVQHEMDHLNGVLFLWRAGQQSAADREAVAALLIEKGYGSYKRI